jgi:GT2 family glycosyltransferase
MTVDASTPGPTPAVSVVVPLDGSPEQALRCLEGLALQPDTPAHEVIVVDDASVGLEPLLARLDGDVEIVRSPHRLGFAGAVKLGVAQARGERVAVLRRAAAPLAGWLAPLASALDDPAVGLAVSSTHGAGSAHAVATWALAARASDLRQAELPSVSEELFAGALALSLSQRGGHVLTASASVVQAPGARIGGARRTPGEPPVLTVVIPTLDAASERVRRCVAAVQNHTDVAHQIVLVDNGAPPQGFSAPVNAGLRAARTPYVVVMNDDVEPLPGWWHPLQAALDSAGGVVFPLTVGGPMRRDFAAWCFAMTADTVAAHSHTPGEFFDPSLVIWYQDTDLLHRLRRSGQPPRCVEASHIRHGMSESVATEDPELSAWIRGQVMKDRESFARKHPDAVLHGHALAGA